MSRLDSGNIFGVTVTSRWDAPVVSVGVNGRGAVAAATLGGGDTADSYDVTVESDFTVVVSYATNASSTPVLRESRDGGRTWATRT
jgi:hypothetical protein